MYKFLNNNLIALFFSVSILVLLSAYFIEYVLGYEACNLCLIGRVPYFFVIIFCSIFFFFKKFRKIILILILITFMCSILIAFYHVGVEQGFFDESLVCDLNPNFEDISREELLKSLKLETISCKDVTFKVLGLSLATINTILSLILSAINIKIFLNYEKN